MMPPLSRHQAGQQRPPESHAIPGVCAEQAERAVGSTALKPCGEGEPHICLFSWGPSVGSLHGNSSDILTERPASLARLPSGDNRTRTLNTPLRGEIPLPSQSPGFSHLSPSSHIASPSQLTSQFLPDLRRRYAPGAHQSTSKSSPFPMACPDLAQGFRDEVSDFFRQRF